MENRFSLKDGIILALLVILLVSIWFGIKQFDRQWSDIKLLKETANQQTTDLADLRKAISGVTAELNELKEKLDTMQVKPEDASEQDGDGEKPEDDTNQTEKPEDNGEQANAGKYPGRLIVNHKETVDPFADRKEARLADDYATGGWFLESFGSQLNTITPLVSSDSYASVVQSYVLESACQRDPDTLQLHGLLAESWQVYDNSEAYLAWEEPIRRELMDKASKDSSVYAEGLEALVDAAKERRQKVDPGTQAHNNLIALALKQWVAAEISKREDRPVAATVVFNLRKNLTFSDGEPLTADDFVFTFNFLMNEAIAAPRARAYFSKISKVEAVDDHTVVFTFGEPYFEAFDLAATMDVLPEHYYSKIKPEVFNLSKGLLVGSGPYRLQDPKGWEPSSTVQLIRNNRYWGELPALDRIVFQLFTQSQARLAAFRNGQVDMLPCSPEQYDELKADTAFAERTPHYEYETPFNGYRYIAWNQTQQDGSPSKFADKRVRQALTMLIDRERIVDEVMRGYGTVATGPFNPLGTQNSGDVEAWAYNPEKAVKLLEEAGWTQKKVGYNYAYRVLPIALIVALTFGLATWFAPLNRSSTWVACLAVILVLGAGAWAIMPKADRQTLLYNDKGEPLKFKLTYPSGSPAYRKMIFQIKDSLAEAGVVMEPNPLEFSVMIERLNNRNFESISLGWTSGPETDIYQMFHSDQIQGNGDNFMSYRNEELDSLIEQARRTIDAKKRMELWQRCHEIMHEDQPYTFISWGKSLRFINPRLKNVEVTNGGLNPATDWYIPKKLQKN